MGKDQGRAKGLSIKYVELPGVRDVRQFVTGGPKTKKIKQIKIKQNHEYIQYNLNCRAHTVFERSLFYIDLGLLQTLFNIYCFTVYFKLLNTLFLRMICRHML